MNTHLLLRPSGVATHSVSVSARYRSALEGRWQVTFPLLQPLIKSQRNEREGKIGRGQNPHPTTTMAQTVVVRTRQYIDTNTPAHTHSPVGRQQTVEYGGASFVLNRYDELIGVHGVVLVQARLQLVAAELAGESAPDRAGANAAERCAVDLLAVLRVPVVHQHLAALARHLPVVGNVSGSDERKSRSRERKKEGFVRSLTTGSIGRDGSNVDFYFFIIYLLPDQDAKCKFSLLWNARPFMAWKCFFVYRRCF